MAGSQNTLLTKWSYPMGGSTTYNSTTTQAGSSVADLPAWAKPYFERNLAKAEAEYGKDYEAYTGDRLAGQSQDTLDAISGTRDLANQEVGITGLSGAQDYMTDGMTTAEGLADYNPNTFTQYGYDDAAKFTGANVGQYMNPYTQNVVDRQKAEAMRDFQRTQGARNAQAVQAGAFGGSRGAVRNFLAEDSMMNRMGMLQDAGLRDAYKDATNQFTASRKADMDVDKARAAELARFEKSTEDADQFAAKQGLAALGVGAGLAKDSVALGELDRQTDIQNLQLLEGIGAAEEGRNQQQLDLDYNEFLAKKGYTAEQIGNMTGILSGMPIAATGTAPAPTPQTNVAGMPQGVASGMAQSMAPKTDVAQNTGIASVAPVATMASGGILKMATAGEENAKDTVAKIKAADIVVATEPTSFMDLDTVDTPGEADRIYEAEVRDATRDTRPAERAGDYLGAMSGVQAGVDYRAARRQEAAQVEADRQAAAVRAETDRQAAIQKRGIMGVADSQAAEVDRQAAEKALDARYPNLKLLQPEVTNEGLDPQFPTDGTLLSPTEALQRKATRVSDRPESIRIDAGDPGFADVRAAEEIERSFSGYGYGDGPDKRVGLNRFEKPDARETRAGI
eukprot:gene2084-5345_t